MRRRWVLLAGLMALLQVCPAVNGAVFQGRYRLALVDTDHPIDNATVWVYVIGWGRLERVQAGVIYSGLVDLRFDPADLPELTPWTFLVAIEFPDGRWFRGSDFPRDAGRSNTSAEEFIEGIYTDRYWKAPDGRPGLGGTADL